MAVMHLDADAFFASVEQRDDPKLRGKPVAVGTGVVASCSYESRLFGVRTGMRLTDARRLCRQLIVMPGEYPRYEQAARHMLAICEEQSPIVEVAALDDLYLDLTRRDQPEKIAGTLRSQIRDEVQLSVSIGVGLNKLVSKVATKDAKQRRAASMARDQAQPGAILSSLYPAVVYVPPGDEQGYLAPWPARVLPGAGRKIGDKLERLNVLRVGEVAVIPLPVLRGLFGKRGPVLRDQAHGIDHRPVEAHKPAQSVSRCTSFDPPTADRAFARAMIDYLLDRAVVWLRYHELATRGIVLTIRYGDYEGAEGRVTLRRPTNDASLLKEAAADRFETLYARRLPLRLVGIALAPLGPPDRQATLFADDEQERNRRLSACTDAIRERFGFTSILNGSGLLLAEQLDRDRENFRMRTPCLTR